MQTQTPQQLLDELDEAVHLLSRCKEQLWECLQNDDILNAKYCQEMIIEHEILIADLENALSVFHQN